MSEKLQKNDKNQPENCKKKLNKTANHKHYKKMKIKGENYEKLTKKPRKKKEKRGEKDKKLKKKNKKIKGKTAKSQEKFQKQNDPNSELA